MRPLHLADHAPPRPAGPVKNGGYIVSPTFDWSLFILPPVFFMALAYLLSVSGIADTTYDVGEGEDTWQLALLPTFSMTFTMAHIVAVFFRSHGNPSIFKLYPLRFTLVPLTLLAAFTFSHTIFLFGLVAATWADNWHSSLQTFGLGRLYDRQAGNDVQRGRRLDVGLALVIFMGPILAGTTLVDALMNDFDRFERSPFPELMTFPGWVEQHQAWLTWPILCFGLGYIGFYLFKYRQYAQQGYRVSKQKVWLFACLATVSILTWGFDPFGQSFFIMESFHSLQYFAIVWWSEGDKLTSRLGLARWRPGTLRLGRGVTFIAFIGSTLAFGLWVSVWADTQFEFALFCVAELMHYWYDGFIWSVRKGQV